MNNEVANLLKLYLETIVCLFVIFIFDLCKNVFKSVKCFKTL